MLFAGHQCDRGDGRPLLEKLRRAGVDTSLIDLGATHTPATFFLTQQSPDERCGLAEEGAFHCALATAQFPVAGLSTSISMTSTWQNA
ncbi:MAG TPA: hypothetical protein VGF67_13195 [Ktedonobacteraceae bacterium]